MTGNLNTNNFYVQIIGELLTCNLFNLVSLCNQNADGRKDNDLDKLENKNQDVLLCSA